MRLLRLLLNGIFQLFRQLFGRCRRRRRFQEPGLFSLLLDSSNQEYARSLGRIEDIEFSDGSNDLPFSISLWIKPDENGAHQKILYYGKEDGSDPCYLIRLVSETHSSIANQVQFYLYDNDFQSHLCARTDLSKPVVRGMWNHIVVTYDGRGHHYGMNIFLNGARTNTVSFSGNGYTAMSIGSSSHRYYLGRSVQPDADEFTSLNLAQVGIFSIDLSEDEVIEIFNQNARIDLREHSRVANLVDYRKLNNELRDSSNHSHAPLDLFRGRFVEELYTQLYFNQGPVSRYVAFGGAYARNISTIQWHGRCGDTHLAGGVITKFEINVNENTCIQTNNVIVDPEYTFRGGSAGIINGKCFVFTSRYVPIDDEFIDIGRYESTDGVVGAAFSNRIDMEERYTRYNFYGKVIRGNDPQEYIVPMYGHLNSDGEDDWLVYLVRTFDNGLTWGYKRVIHSINKYGETAILNLGDGNYLLVTRNNDGGLYACTSTDNLDYISNYTRLNSLGIEDRAMADLCLDDENNIILIYADRNDGFIKVSTGNPISRILQDIDSWNAPVKIAKSFPGDRRADGDILGYPSIVNIGNNRFCITYSSERSRTRADLMYGIGTL